MTRTCPQCERRFKPKRPHQICESQECRYQRWVENEVEAAQTPAQRVEPHPLREVREGQEATDLKSKLSQIIYNGIIERLKLGSVHADDLEPLFPEAVRDVCRKLVGAQFGSLASRGYITETERRKSKVKSRKGAKSGVYTFTPKGRETLAGVHLDASPSGEGSNRTLARVEVDSGEKPSVGVPCSQGMEGSPASPVGADAGDSPEPLSLFPVAPSPTAEAA